MTTSHKKKKMIDAILRTDMEQDVYVYSDLIAVDGDPQEPHETFGEKKGHKHRLIRRVPLGAEILQRRLSFVCLCIYSIPLLLSRQQD
jgi:hypothetical protein